MSKFETKSHRQEPIENPVLKDFPKETTPEFIFDHETFSLVKVNKVIADISKALASYDRQDAKYKILKEYWHSFNTIADFLKGTPVVFPSKIDTNRWEEYESGKGLVRKEIDLLRLAKVSPEELKKIREERNKGLVGKREEWMEGHTFRDMPSKVEFNIKGVESHNKKNETPILEPESKPEEETQLAITATPTRDELIKHAMSKTLDRGMKYLDYEKELKKLLAEHGYEKGGEVEVKVELPIKEVSAEELPSISKIDETFSPAILDKIASIKGLTLEKLQAIPEFAHIAESEGRVWWLIDKLNGVRLKDIKKKAVEDHEKNIRESKGVSRIYKSILRKGMTGAREAELIESDFDTVHALEEIKGLIHIAEAGPELKLKEDGGGVIAEYLDNISGVEHKDLAPFNEAATEYSNIPPKHLWIKAKNSDRERFEKISQCYEEEKVKVLAALPEHFKNDEETGEPKKYTEREALLLINQKDFEIKSHQTINAYPNAELELHKLAEAKGWSRTWEAAKSQLAWGGVSGSAGIVIGAATRFGVKTALISTGAAIALPFAAMGLGAGLGVWKAGNKAKENLRKEEELMRMGFECQTKSSQKIQMLLQRRAGVAYLFSQTEKEDGYKDEHQRARGRNQMKGELEDMDKQLIKLRSKNTDLNINKAENHLLRINGLQEQLNNEIDETKKRDIQEKLELRIEFTRNKLEEGKMSFGKDDVALKTRLDLIQALGAATADVALLPQYEEREFIRPTSGEKVTRRSQLEKVVSHIEQRIEKNRKGYVNSQRAIGAATGLGFGAVGSGIGYLAGDHVHAFGSELIHTINEKVQELKAIDWSEGKALEEAVKVAVKSEVAKEASDQIIIGKISEYASGNKTAKLFNGFKQQLEDRTLINTEMPKVPEVAELKTFEIELTKESQSKEWALKKYYEEKMSPEEAGKQAHLKIREWFGPKGEGGYVHKGDVVQFSEEKGKLVMKVVPKDQVLDSVPAEKVAAKGLIQDGQFDTFTNKKIGGDSAERAVTRMLRLNAETYGFKGDPSDIEEVKEWSHARTQEVIKQNPKIRSIITHDGDMLDLSRTTAGGWHAEVVKGGAIEKTVPTPISAPEPLSKLPTSVTAETPLAAEISSVSPEVSTLLETFKVEAPSSVPQALDAVLGKDPSFASLDAAGKDRALGHLFAYQYLAEMNRDDFYTDLNMKEGDLLEVKGGTTLNLAGPTPNDKNVFADAIKYGKESDSTQYAGFRSKMKDVIEYLKQINPEDINAGTLETAIKEVKK